MKHFLPGNNQDKMNAFDINKIDFFAKFYTHQKLGGVQPTQSPIPEEGATIGRKICEKTSQTKSFTLHFEPLKIFRKFD